MPARRPALRHAWLIVAAAPLALTACAAGTSPATPQPAAPSPTAAAAAPQTGPARCTGQHAKVDLILQDNHTTANSRLALMELTNTSDQPCTVEGWATVMLTDAANETVKVPTRTVEQPGPASLITLKPGTSASAGVKWTTCDKSTADCPAGNGLKVTLPKDATTVTPTLSSFPDATKSNLTMKELQIGTLQPSAQGVVAW